MNSENSEVYHRGLRDREATAEILSEPSSGESNVSCLSDNGDESEAHLKSVGTEDNGRNLESNNFDQEMVDSLFEAGYSLDEINQVVASRSLDKDTSSFHVPESEPEIDQDEVLSEENASDLLRKIRIKNVNKVVIGSLNINSLPNKFAELKEVIGKNIDVLAIQETKLDSSFPPQQFVIDGYSEPYRLDRNRDGQGGGMQLIHDRM